MQRADDRAKPYNIRIPANQMAAELHLGWRSYAASVRQLSWAGAVVSVTPAAAEAFRRRRVGRLVHQNTAWEAVIESEQMAGGNEILLTLQRVESSHSETAKYTESVPAAQHWLHTDPLFAGLILFALLASMLIMPGWGEELGTSQAIGDAAVTFGRGIVDFCR